MRKLNPEAPLTLVGPSHEVSGLLPLTPVVPLNDEGEVRTGYPAAALKAAGAHAAPPLKGKKKKKKRKNY